MNKRTYASQLLGYTFRRSVIVTDRASILIGPLVAAYFWLRGKPMPNDLAGLIAVGVLITVGAALALRLMSAQYIMWRRDQAQIKRLRETLGSPLRRAKDDAASYRSGLRRELSETMARIIVFAETMQTPAFVKALGAPSMTEKYLSDVIRAREIISALSYDVVLRVCCLNLIKLCARIVGETAEKDADLAPLNDRLWAQRKLTFRLLHYDFPSDVLALAHIENLIANDGEGFRPGQESDEVTDALEDLKKMLRDHPELHGPLERQLDGSDTDS